MESRTGTEVAYWAIFERERSERIRERSERMIIFSPLNRLIRYSELRGSFFYRLVAVSPDFRHV